MPAGPWSPPTRGRWPGADGAWEALFDAYGVIRVRDLDEMTDTLELFAAGRRAPPGGRGIATVHDSGAERALVADVADVVGVPFARSAPATEQRLAALLDPGLIPDNPLDVWGTGADTEALFAGCLPAMAEDAAVSAVALAVDLVEEYDGDESYPNAVIAAAAGTDQAGGGPVQSGQRASTRRRPPGSGPPGYPCSRGPAAGCSAAGPPARHAAP